MVKVSDIIAQFLKEQKIDTVFGIIGSANSHIFDSIDKLGYTKIINTHHEQAAVLAMGAYYRASGKLSAAIVTAGGGATNAVTGVVSNWADSIPGIIISGQENYNYVSTNLTKSDRPGPVWLDIPMNLQAKLVEQREWDFSIPKKTYRLNINKVVDLIKESKRPVILGGHGVRLAHAKKEFNQLVTKLRIPTVLSWSGIDLLEDKDPNFFGRFG